MAFALGTSAGAGTISVAAGSVIVTGAGTNFVAANVGAIIVVGTQWGVIATRASTTSVTLDRPLLTAVTGSAYQISADIPVITQTGTDASYDGLAGVPGATKSTLYWTLTSARLQFNGINTPNRLTNRIRMLNTATINSTTIAAIQFGPNAVFNNSVAQAVGGYAFNSPSSGFIFELALTTVSTIASLINAEAGSNVTIEGDHEFINTGAGPLMYAFGGTAKLQNGSMMNASVTGANYLTVVSLSTASITYENFTMYGIAPRVANNTTIINKLAVVGGPQAININTSSAIDNPIYRGVQDFGCGQTLRYAASSLKYAQLQNLVSNKPIPTFSMQSNIGSSVLVTSTVQILTREASGPVSGAKIWAKDSNNGLRYSANYGAGKAYEIATTGDFIYSATSVDGVAVSPTVISHVVYMPTGTTYVVDHRGNGGATSAIFNYFIFSYLHEPLTVPVDTWALDNGVYGSTSIKTGTALVSIDARITQADIATVAAYTTLDTAQQLYDYAKFHLYTNFAGQTETYVTRSGNTINAGAYNVIIDATAASVFVRSAASLTFKSSVFTGSLTTTGLVTLANGAVMQNSVVTGNVAQAVPKDLSGVTIDGNLTYDTNAAITVTLTDCAISGTVSNSGTGAVTINRVNSSIGTVGARVATRPVTALTLTGLLTNSQIYIADGSGTQVAYVASSGTSYTLDTTGQTGAWTWKVARYNRTAQIGTHSPAVASTAVAVTLEADLFVTQATKPTVASYGSLENLDRLYDFAAYYETTQAGIRYPRIITKAGTSASAGIYPVTINDLGDLFIFDGESLSIYTNYTLAGGATITGALFTTGVVTLPINFNDAAIIANVSQPDPGDLDGISITGNLTYGTSAPFGINVTLTDCAVTGTVSNAGTTDVVITKVNTTLGVVGTRVTAQQFATVSAPNLISGTRVRLLNTTNNIEMFNGVIGSGGFSQNFVYVGDKTVTLTATYASGVTAKLGLSATGIFTAGGLTFLAAQADDVVYNAYNIDGATVTGFVADYVETDVNLIMANCYLASRLYAWWIYTTTTEQGIRQFFGGITGIDESNIRINVPTVNLYLDNETPDFILQKDNIRIYRSDGLYPARKITSGGGGIHVNWSANVYTGTNESLGATVKDALNDDLAPIKLIPALI